MKTRSISVPLTGPTQAREVLRRILDHARARGIDQRALAARANIAPESLSRLKRSGGCRLTTVLELARAAGLTALHLEDDAPAPRVAASMAARKLSAGRRCPVTAEELVAALAGGELKRERIAHLAGFFEELPIESVHDVILDEKLDYAHLHALAGKVGAEGETVAWLAEMAGDGVADAA